MAGKRALIVDDSKSARSFLARILEKYEIEVETAESAELALEYLATHSPDVIFMDHLMPGMDGFQAVQAIKNNPRTAAIPIMMYTSQEGELYLGQARALGAVGVLPKQIRPADVSKVLYQLKLVADRRSEEQQSFRSVDELVPAVAGFDAAVGVGAAATEHNGVAVSDGHTQTDAAPRFPGSRADAETAFASARRASDDEGLRQALDAVLHAQIVELRQFVTLSLDHQAARTASELRQLAQDLRRPTAVATPIVRASPWPWLLACAAALATVAFGLLWYQENGARLLAEGKLAEAAASAAAAATAVAAARAPPPAAPLLSPETPAAEDSTATSPTAQSLPAENRRAEPPPLAPPERNGTATLAPSAEAAEAAPPETGEGAAEAPAVSAAGPPPTPAPSAPKSTAPGPATESRESAD